MASGKPGAVQGSQIEKLVNLAKAEKPCLFFDIDLVEVVKQRLFNGRNDSKLDKPAAFRKLAKELEFKVADREHRINLINWRSSPAHGISLDLATVNGALELLKGKDPHQDRIKELISFSELTLELLGPVSM
jgi:hypothetical protein